VPKPKLRHAPSRAVVGIGAAAVWVAAAVPYIASINGFWVGDDFAYVQLLFDKPVAHFLRLFAASWADDVWGLYLYELRPVLAASYRLCALGGLSPAAFHAFNVLIHVANAALVFAFAHWALRLSLRWAVYAALLFAVLPIHAEAVYWISGRSDSLVCLFSLLTLLTWAMWRHTGASHWLYLSLCALFTALFTKETALILPFLMFAYDAFVACLGWRRWRAWLFEYAPVLVLAIGYLLVRAAVMPHVFTGATVNSAQLLSRMVRYQAAYFAFVFTAEPMLLRDRLLLFGLEAAAVAAVAAGGAILLARNMPAAMRDAQRRLIFLAPIWWFVATGPMLAAEYISPRHLYLASVGVALSVAALFEICHSSAVSNLRRGGVAVSGILLVLCGCRLIEPVRAWHTANDLSRAITRDVERQATLAPVGALMVIAAPATFSGPVLPQGRAVGRPLVWSYSVPFALKPPFTRTDLTRRVFVLVPPDVYCCPQDQWTGAIRKAVREWSIQNAAAPVFLLRWDSAATLQVTSDSTQPNLRQAVIRLGQSSDTEAEFAEITRHYQ
jgi:hypothetical protein